MDASQRNTGAHTIKFERLALRLHTSPLQPLINNEVHDAAVIPLQPMGELPIPPQLTWHAMKLVDPVAL